LADKDNLGFSGPFAEDDLRGIPIEITAAAAFGLMPQFGDAFRLRDVERQGRPDVCNDVHDAILISADQSSGAGIVPAAKRVASRQNDHGEKFRVMGESRRD